MKKSIEAWFDNADIKSDKLCELFIILNVNWFHHCKWAVIADSDLSLKCNLTTELMIEQTCDKILSEIWFIRTSNAANINYSKIYFLITNKIRVFDNHVKQYNEIFVLFLFFAFIINEIEIDRKSLKITVFQYLENLF